MFISFRLSRGIAVLCIAFLLVSSLTFFIFHSISRDAATKTTPQTNVNLDAKKDFIKWVDFGITEAAMNAAMKADIESHDSKTPIDWIDLLAYLGAKYGGNFTSFKTADLSSLVDRLKRGEKIEDITKDMKYYSYYHQAYTAVLGGFLGEYEIQEKSETDELVWTKKYGLKGFSPIAKNYGYSHYDDFGASRSYGYQRKHLGHDMMGGVGTPIIATESGTVEAIGWNQYGGWRIGIRSFDKKRYYYYAHLRKNHPYPKDLSIGHTVKAGDVIGYLGMTGYSAKENTNNIDTPHLHFGIQLIFDESQKDGNGEIWIDCFEIIKFLSKNRSEVVKDELMGEYRRKYDFFEESVNNME
ncbi:MAG: M23 family metallopeptidase [Clostridia bacterium]|nr:M23 family metallopeptidase [Clostridia bacterium]